MNARLAVRLPRELLDVLDTAATADQTPLENYAGYVLLVGWETLHGIRQQHQQHQQRSNADPS